MATGYDRTLEIFEQQKQQLQKKFDAITRFPSFRMTVVDERGPRDFTNEYKSQLLADIDQWQKAIDYLRSHKPEQE